jgi:hypothetical protein
VGTEGRQITLAYESEFQKGHAKETFVWRLHGDRAALIGYHVDSPVFAAQ